MNNDQTYRQMLLHAEAKGESVVFILEEEDRILKGTKGVNVYKVPVPGTLDRQAHFVAWFMHLTAFHGPAPQPGCDCDECQVLR